jgi:hypothetical protein
MNMLFTECLKQKLDHAIEITEVDHHINDQAFAEIAAPMIYQMI